MKIKEKINTVLFIISILVNFFISCFFSKLKIIIKKKEDNFSVYLLM